jgi:hypothetical protein
VILWRSKKKQLYSTNVELAVKTKPLSGIIKNSIIPNKFYLPWLTTIVEEDYTKYASCDANSEVSCAANVHSRNLPVEILASTLWYIIKLNNKKHEMTS